MTPSTTAPSAPAAAPELPTAQAIEARLRERLCPSALEVHDDSAAHAGHAGANGLGRGTHFRVRVASPLFAGKSRVACHRLVYDALQDYIDAGLHALQIDLSR
jgi:BolA family transcriptional regulator, general stress-responsive regulator